MALLGLAPVAGPSLAAEAMAQPTPIPMAWAPSVASMAMDKVAHDHLPDGDADLRYAQRQLDLLKWRRSQGFRGGPGIRYETCWAIESRKATSPAIKAILNRERQERLELEEHEETVRFHLVKRLAPDWVRRALS